MCFQVTVNFRPARLPFSRQSLYVEDTGSMYLLHTPGGISIQWYHSTGIMVLQYMSPSNASVPTRGLCGESFHLTHCHSQVTVMSLNKRSINERFSVDGFLTSGGVTIRFLIDTISISGLTIRHKEINRFFWDHSHTIRVKKMFTYRNGFTVKSFLFKGNSK